MLRINPSNTCQIQILNCSTGAWDLWLDVSTCATEAIQGAGGIGQQTDDEPIPPAECRDYDLVVPANQQYLLPVLLNSGDTITVTNTSGAANDGILLAGIGTWNIPNGGVYRGPLGNEPDNTSFNEDDPKPDSPHMCLIMNIDGTWYDAFDADGFVVPSGSVSDNLVFQVNDSQLGDNSGSYSFQVSVCKNEIPPVEDGNWIRVYDFRGGNAYGWHVTDSPATWSGNGWLFDGFDQYIFSADLSGLDTIVTRLDTFWSEYHSVNTVFNYSDNSTVATLPQAAETDFIVGTPVHYNNIGILTEWDSSHLNGFLYKIIVYGTGTPMPGGVNPL